MASLRSLPLSLLLPPRLSRYAPKASPHSRRWPPLRNRNPTLASREAAPMGRSDFRSMPSFFKEGFGLEDEPSSPAISGLTALEDQDYLPCPPGLRKYNSMIVFRPDVSEDELLYLTEKYEEVMHYYT